MTARRALAAAALAVMALLTATGCHVNAWNVPGGVASTVRG